MEKLNRAQKCSILGPQNLGSRGGLGPWVPLDPHLKYLMEFDKHQWSCLWNSDHQTRFWRGWVCDQVWVQDLAKGGHGTYTLTPDIGPTPYLSPLLTPHPHWYWHLLVATKSPTVGKQAVIPFDRQKVTRMWENAYYEH